VPNWSLRYATHLGYRPPERALFAASAGPDPAAHVDYAAELGFAGVQYARALTRSKEERARVRGALERHGLEMGCVIYAGREICSMPLWGATDAGSREVRENVLREGIDIAREVNSRYVVLLSGSNPAQPLGFQLAALTENLKRAAELAAERDVVLLLESLSRKARPGELLVHVADAYAVARAVDNPHVRLIFDTAHVQSEDGDLLANLAAVWDAVEIVQIADNPGRLEPGSGEINFANVLRALRARGFCGLVELEHDWSEETRDCEQRGLERLRALDASL
jgi:hydroxypyruvate isomerase